MKKCLLPLIAIALAGCHVKVDEPPVMQQQATAAATYKAPEPTAQVAKATPKANDETKKPGYNPSRLHQLSSLKTTQVTINGHALTAWVMDNDSLRQEGMMFVKDSEVKPDQAMLFVFPDSSERGFWMHNTIMPLDVAYIGADKKVVSAATMQPLDEKSTPSHGAAKYVLEMKKGTLDQLGIRKGTEVSFSDSIKATDPPPPANPMGGP